MGRIGSDSANIDLVCVVILHVTHLRLGEG